MKAHDLARLLLAGNNYDAVHVWDGASRANIEHVWETKSGHIATADHDMVVYYDEDRPVEGPSEKENKHWRTPEAPKE